MTGAGGEQPPPKPISEALLDVVFAFAAQWRVSPYDVLLWDVDDFFLLAAYLIARGRQTPTENAKTTQSSPKEERIRVNDKTATGGWF